MEKEKRFCLREGITQERLAEKMGVPQCEISRIERSLKSLRFSTVKKYADACGFDIKFVHKGE